MEEGTLGRRGARENSSIGPDSGAEGWPDCYLTKIGLLIFQFTPHLLLKGALKGDSYDVIRGNGRLLKVGRELQDGKVQYVKVI